jgi:RimJ/RimL family protein N-acetyltransferase
MNNSQPKVRLRSLSREDMARIFLWKTDRQALHFLGRDPDMPRSQEKFVERFQRQLLSPQARRLVQGIEAPNGELVGYVSVFNIDLYRKMGQFSILIGDKAYWDRGLGTAAARLFLRRIFGETSLKYLFLYTAHFNTRAQRCFEKCGFRVVWDYMPARDGSAYESIKMMLTREMYLRSEALWRERMADPER